MGKKYFVKKYGNKAFTAKELVDLEYDLNSYDAVKSDTDLNWKTYKDYDFHSLAAEDLDYEIGEDGVIHKKKSSNDNSGKKTGDAGVSHTNNTDEGNGLFIIAIVFGILFIALIIMYAAKNSNDNYYPEAVDSVSYEEILVDSVVIDSAVIDGNEYYSEEYAVVDSIPAYEVENDFLDVSQTSISFDSNANSITIYIGSGTSWRISTPPDYWGRCTRKGDLLTISVDKNTSTSPREDYIEISSLTKTVRVEIYQDGRQKRYARNATGNIQKIWIEHNVIQDGVKGMRIHLKFDVNNMKGFDGETSAYFHYSNGNPLKDNNNTYCTQDRQVAVSEDFVPPYDSTEFGDFTLFMPYSELHLSQSTNCYFYVIIWSGQNAIDQSENQYFNISL